jgi:hypothetical protein
MFTRRGEAVLVVATVFERTLGRVRRRDDDDGCVAVEVLKRPRVRVVAVVSTAESFRPDRFVIEAEEPMLALSVRVVVLSPLYVRVDWLYVRPASL